MSARGTVVLSVAAHCWRGKKDVSTLGVFQFPGGSQRTGQEGTRSGGSERKRALYTLPQPFPSPSKRTPFWLRKCFPRLHWGHCGNNTAAVFMGQTSPPRSFNTISCNLHRYYLQRDACCMVASPAEKPPIMLAVTKLTLIMGLKLWEEWRREKQQASGDGEAAQRRVNIYSADWWRWTL